METADREISLSVPRFGTVTYREAEIIRFPWGLPGFGSLRRFIALSLQGQEKFVWLQSLDDPTVALPTCDPWLVFADYKPQLPGYAASSLEIGRPEDFVALCVVVVTPSAEEATMNLLAPIIINLQTRVARQVPLETGGYSVRTPLPRKARAAAAGA